MAKPETVEYDVCPQIQGPLQIGGHEGVVDDCQLPGLFRYVGHCCYIRHGEKGVGRAFDVDGFYIILLVL